MTDEQGASPSVIGALVLMSLVPGDTTVEATQRDIELSRLALELQKTAMSPDLLSMGTLFHGGEWAVDRITEIVGRIGSAGEQLGLALAASRDARRWLDGEARHVDQVVAVRAHAEVETYWTLGAAHGLGNVLLRILALHPQASVAIDSEYTRARGLAPFSELQAAWESFGPRLVRTARAAAESTSSPAVDRIIDAFGKLSEDPKWIALLDLRGENFHRWRPQSVPGGDSEEKCAGVVWGQRWRDDHGAFEPN